MENSLSSEQPTGGATVSYSYNESFAKEAKETSWRNLVMAVEGVLIVLSLIIIGLGLYGAGQNKMLDKKVNELSQEVAALYQQYNSVSLNPPARDEKGNTVAQTNVSTAISALLNFVSNQAQQQQNQTAVTSTPE